MANATEETAKIILADLDTLAHAPSDAVPYTLPAAGVLPLSGGTATSAQTNPITRPSWANAATIFCYYTAGSGATVAGARVAVYVGASASSTLLPADDGSGGGGLIGAFTAPGGAILIGLRLGGATRLGLSCNDTDAVHAGTLAIDVIWHRD